MLKIVIELFLPLIISNVMHMIIVKHNFLRSLNKPLSRRFFGANKTYRGFLVISFLTGTFEIIFVGTVYGNASFYHFWFGALLGFVFLVSELPNSYIKRKLGIPPGGKPSKNKLVFMILDKTDSTFGVCVTYTLVKNLSLTSFFIMFFSAFLMHLSLSHILTMVKIKESL